jgi:hypothetical protein
MIVERFDDFMDMSFNEHKQLAAILDNYSSMQDCEDGYDEEFFENFSISMEA